MSTMHQRKQFRSVPLRAHQHRDVSRTTEDHLPIPPTDWQAEPVTEGGTRPRSRPRSPLFLFIGVALMCGLIVAYNGVSGVIAAHTLDSTYGMPRTWQVDAVVGHADSPAHPSHFLFENLRGQVLILEFAGGNPAHAIIYVGPVIMSAHAEQIPVTGAFTDVNRDGRIDLLVSVGSQQITYLNNGKQFSPQ